MRSLRNWTFIASALLLAWPAPGQQNQVTQIRIDANAPTTPFPHFWEQTFGSGRAILSLRESYRKDLETVKQATDFKSVRFHGILMDEVGLYDLGRVIKNPGLTAEAVRETSQYNFMYVDQIYDNLLRQGVRPFVELSFMPRKMAADPNELHPFFYHPVVSPPRDYTAWDAMIQVFARHLIGRYGIEEVSTWKFEVWNEPNLDFWGGSPKQATYWTLYDHTARALKSVSDRLQVGGPATAQAAWIPAFLAHVYENHVAVDFVSSHVYGNDSSQNVLGTDEQIARDQMVYRAVKKVHDEIASSPLPHLPLIFSEFGASYSNEPNVTDSPFMGAWIASTIRLCDGLAESVAYWTLSDVFEEQGVPRSPFYGGFGLIGADNIPKPSLNAFRILHQLGDRRIPTESDSSLATKLQDGGVAIALWDYAPPGGSGPNYTPQSSPPGESKTFVVHFTHLDRVHKAVLLRVDRSHGNSLALYDQMGRPDNLTQDEIEKLQRAGAMAPPEHLKIQGGEVTVTVPPYGLALLLIHKE